MCLFVLSLGSRAHATHMMNHYDLASLVLESDVVVRATKSEAGFTVTRIYAGKGLDVGSVVTPSGGFEVPGDVTDTVLFLDRKGDSGWAVVESGQRLIVGDRVQRFVMESGRLNSVVRSRPAGHDPAEVRGFEAPEEGIPVAAFEGELATAVARARRVSNMLTDVASYLGGLVDELGPVEDDEEPLFAVRGRLVYEDRVATKILAALATAGDARVLVDAMARSRGGVRQVSSSRLMKPLAQIALDLAQLPVRRVAALELFAKGREQGQVDEALRRSIAELRDDPEASVRAAAFRALDDAPSRSVAVGAIRERWPVETEPGVQIALLRVAHAHGVASGLDRAKIDGPLLHAERRGRRLRVEWYGDADEGTLSTVTLALKRDADLARTITVPVTCMRAARGESCEGPIHFGEALSPGTYTIEAIVELEKKGSAIARRSIVSPFRVAAPEKPRPTPLIDLDVVGKNESAPPRGCACELSGASSGPWGLALALVMIVAVRLSGSRRSS